MRSVIRVLSDPPRVVQAIEGETILASLLQADVPFPHNCQSGNCGACKCELVEGDTLELPHSEYAISEEEKARGLILACRTQVWGDCTVRALEAEEVVLHPSRVMRCRVTEMTDLTHDIKRVRLSIQAGGPYSFSAGQHAQLKFGPGIPERSYSMANRPDETPLEFIIRHVPHGQASGYAFTSLHVGSEVTVSGPHGTAYLRENHGGPILAVAGGSGLAPIKSIVDTVLRGDPARLVRLYFGVRDEPDVYMEEELTALANEHSNVSVHIVLSRPVKATSRRTGLVVDAVMEDVASFEGVKAYAAGPPPMVEALQRRLEAESMRRIDIHADAFYSQDEGFEGG
jgi:naphthalene 1,2-dioxygenase ferredoxin reductase component